MEQVHSIDVTSEWHLLEILEKMIEILVEARNAYGVVTVDEPTFLQVMVLDDGGLRLESSGSDKVIAANVGFDERVEQYEHIATATIPGEWPTKTKVAAETMTLLAVDVHEVKFPASIDFYLDLTD